MNINAMSLLNNKWERIPFNEIPSPCFLLEEAALIRNLELLRDVQNRAEVDIICALKGFAFHAVFPLLANYLKGATASSLNEALLVQEKMGKKVHSYCAAYVPSDFQQIARLSSHLSFNSVNEYHRYQDRIPNDVQVGLRVNPAYSEIETPLYDPADPNCRLGIAVEELGASKLPEGITGLHFHALCENNSYTLEKVLASFEEKFATQLKQCTWVNMGGGHLVTSADYDADHLVQILHAFKKRNPSIKKIILEPGSAIGWDTGYLVSTVLDIVNKGELPTAMLDVSFTCHMPDCLEMPYQPAILNAQKGRGSKHHYRMGGLSCLAGDVMGDWSFETPLKVGDRIVFDDMIHYTMVKTSQFNGLQIPEIGIWKKGGGYESVRKFTYADYKRMLG
ncbi:carboxynorspermidine decarboxylase [Chitinophagales bacterium]|nr:carboxynorspermidine decarboxylase [Chitinophagales bacterium]